MGEAVMSLDITRRGFGHMAAMAGMTVCAGQIVPAAAENANGPASLTMAAADSPPSAASSSAPVPLAPPDKQPPNLKIPELVTRKAGFAIVGLGELALQQVMPAFGECKLAKPVALVSGHPDKARKVAAVYGIKDSAVYDYQNFDRIAENDEIDAVYIILPNSMHAEYTIRAFKAGKHVLCEKPMAVTVEECERMLAAGREANKQLMIAYRLHYEPLNRKVMEMCQAKAFGAIKSFSSSNCQNTKAPNIRLSGELGGGPVGDTGVYSINAARYVTGEEPVEVTAFAYSSDDPRFREVPETVAFTLRFPSGVLAHCDCSFNASVSRRYRVNCEKGLIEMDPAFSYEGLRLYTKKDTNEDGGSERTEVMEKAVNHFAAEMDHLADCILNGKPNRTRGEEGLADMRIVVAIAEAARSGRTVKIIA